MKQQGPGELIMSRPTEDMLDRWRVSAENLVAHFAVVCHGQHPLSLNWAAPANITAAGMDGQSAAFMTSLTQQLAAIQCLSPPPLAPFSVLMQSSNALTI